MVLFFKKSYFLGLAALSEVNLPAWDTGICFRNKILLHYGVLCKNVLFKSPGGKGQSLGDTGCCRSFLKLINLSLSLAK